MASPEIRRPPRDTRVGSSAVGAISVSVLIVFFASTTVMLLYAVLIFWPPDCPAASQPTGSAVATPVPAATPAAGEPESSATATSCTNGGQTALAFWGVNLANREQNLLLLVATLGALGAMGHVLRSFFKYVGERHLVWSWVPSYVLTPFVGAILAVLTYIVLRAGLLGTASGEAVVGNTWGFAAVATLVGLFSAQAATKLKQVFVTIFAADDPGSESVAQDDDGGPPTITGFSLATAKEGATVDIQGIGLEAAASVRFGGGVDSKAAWVASEGVLRTIVPVGALDGPLTVTVAGATLTSPTPFTVDTT